MCWMYILFFVNHMLLSLVGNRLRICEAKLDAETFAWEGIQ